MRGSGACGGQAGIKFGANMWIHQFDFKTPSERGCKLTYVNTAGKASTHTNAHKHTQTHTNTHKHTQTHTNTPPPPHTHTR